MRRVGIKIGLLVVVVAGLWMLWHRDRIHNLSDVFQLASEHWATVQSSLLGSSNNTEPDRNRDTILIASFNLRVTSDFGGPGYADERGERVRFHMVELFRLFDLIAIQGIGPDRSPDLIEWAHAANNDPYSQYSVVMSDLNANDTSEERAAFVFNRARVQLDRAGVYSIADPDGVFVRAPFVGCFRAVGPPTGQAFTFSLVNLEIDRRSPTGGLLSLREIVREVRRDGRNEDDVLLAGEFHTGDQGLEFLRRYGYVWVVSDTPTDTRYTTQSANLLFDSRATTEFIGRGGVLNLVKHFNVSLQEALAISENVPVWGEFSVFEGYEMDPAKEVQAASFSTR